ncbi:MAG: H+/Na+-translocating ferredoxin:NAD+ oxidoreductase subunit [Acidobacteriota bacterium]|nr:H+/Na+-translocating ferredoxin:NAD+ oxidoreductase subunit [Acidobacteriota bacterium]
MNRAPDPRLVVQAAPFLRPQVSTPRIMGDVLIALAPATAAGLWFFGLSALLVVLASTAACVATDWALGGRAQLADLSAVVTGVLVGLILPPSLPLWMAALGGFVAIALGKAAWGGLGHNLFNPALVGRAFLQAAFPIALTTWVPPQGLFALYSGNLALPFMSAPADAVTSATPLGQMKFLGVSTPLADLFWGNVSGSIGETSAAAILLGALYLVARRACDWRLPAGMLGAAALLAELLHQIAPAKYPGAMFTLLSGGLLLGAVFMASDPVTSPLAPRGAWIVAAGAGGLVVLIRFWGGRPEGVMYAILLMNSASPLIDRALQPRRFGGSAPKVGR